MALAKEQIWEAADRLSEQGRKPTLVALREAVGGSYSTLAPALREWKARQAQRPEAAGETVPPEVERRVRRAGAAIWATAARLAAERLASERSALEQERKAAAEELAEADRQQRRCRKLEAQLAESEALLASVRAEAREDIDKARRRELAAREDAAGLRGALAAHQEQTERLLASLSPAPPAD